MVTVGTDASALVSLLQAPEAVRGFAAWVRERCGRSGDSIEVSAKRGDRRIRLKADGDVDVKTVADFLTSAFANPDETDALPARRGAGKAETAGQKRVGARGR